MEELRARLNAVARGRAKERRVEIKKSPGYIAMCARAKESGKRSRAAFKVAQKVKKKASSKMMPFVTDLAHRVLIGKTVASFRLNKYSFYPRVGEEFTARVQQSSMDATFKCTRCAPTTLRHVRDNYWQQIGGETAEAYLEMMKDILKKEVLDLDMKGFLYLFERIA